ncbi:MAG TPA: DUF2813 domain-containing protein, partial [Gammaproteobacteria bacterium]|nr:DUF2813 domain-containing protein [Gammaproteobacteria bacterium]
MFLRSLCIENFRSIRSAELEFDDTTLLTGENGCGKSSLFEALAIALVADDRPPRFEAHHFHRAQDSPVARPLGSIRIELTFEEREAGEWNRLEAGVLAPLWGSAASQPRRLVLSLRGDPPQDAAPVEGTWRIFSPGSSQRADDADALAMLRSLNRFVRLHEGSLFDTRAHTDRADPVDRSFADDIAPLAEEIQAHQEKLESGTARHEKSELKAGYEAALELLSRRAVDSHSAGALSGSLVEEILAQRGLDAGERAQSFHGSAAQQLGVLILTAAILRHHPGVPITGAEFIMVFEDPEAHLHLMTLASVWGLLDNLQAQKIISTQSGTLLASAPLYNMRRLTRHDGVMTQWRVRQGSLNTEELRKLSYHLRVRRADASFARCWLLVEGETEFWML